MKKMAIILAILTLALTGCNSKTEVASIGEQTQEAPKQQTEKKPEKVVEETFDAIKKTDMEKITKLLTGEVAEKITEGDAFLELMKVSNKMLNYKITNTVINNDAATVTVECTYGDVKPIFGAAFKEYFQAVMQKAFSGTEPTEEELNEMLSTAMLNAIETTQAEEYSTTIEVPCIKVDKKWAIDSSTDNVALADVMTGNLASALQDMADSMNQGE